MEIIVNSISVEICGKKIFSDVSFSTKSGQMIAITGASGCGKTTLLNCIGLIQPISKGSILINGSKTDKWNDTKKTRFWNDNATFIYQDYGIIEDECVAYNITLNKSKMRSGEVKDILRRVGLPGREKDMAMVLSGGEKQRIGIARALFKRAQIIYADEPTASLDASNRKSVVELLRQCAKQGTIVILATHDERLAAECDKVIDMTVL